MNHIYELHYDTLRSRVSSELLVHTLECGQFENFCSASLASLAGLDETMSGRRPPVVKSSKWHLAEGEIVGHIPSTNFASFNVWRTIILKSFFGSESASELHFARLRFRVQAAFLESGRRSTLDGRPAYQTHGQTNELF